MLPALFSSLSLTPCSYGPRPWLPPVRARSPRCAASAGSTVGFDEALCSIMAQADETGSLEGAVDTWLDRLDENFIPMLAGRVEAADLAESGLPDADAPREQELLQLLMQRSQQGFEACSPSPPAAGGALGAEDWDWDWHRVLRAPGPPGPSI